jgi:hypothetical protein
MERLSKQWEERLRRKYPEVHGKVVDFITHTIDDGTLYLTVRFTDQTSFCVRYACDMFAVGIELSAWQSGDFHIIREYMRPIPRYASNPFWLYLRVEAVSDSSCRIWVN